MTLGAIGCHFGSFLVPFRTLLVILAPFWYQNHSKNEPRTPKGSRSPFRDCVFGDLWWFRRLWEPLRIANASPILGKSSKGSQNNIFQLGRWCVWTMPASVLWRSTVFHFFCEKRRHSRNSSRHSQKSLYASSRTTALGPGYPFWELLSAFLMPFSSQSEKVENATAPKREPTFRWSGGSLFRPFSTLDQKTLSQHTFTFFFMRFLHHFGLSGRCPRTNQKQKHKETLQKTHIWKF